MLMFVRRTRRRSVLTAAVVAGTLVAAVATATPAAAVGGTFLDPQAAPVTIPGTSTVVNEWKLAGKGFAQGVQIAPQWVLASGHAPPRVGATFTNAYGSATVDQVRVCATQGSGCDVSVSHLSTPIAAAGFVPLLLDGVPDQTGLTPAGNTLAVGNGGSTLGRPTAGWTQPTQNGMTLATLQHGPAAINGDSGGPAFYYYQGRTTGVLQGLMTEASYGVISGLQNLTTARIRPFVDGILPAGTVNWVTYDQLGARRFRPEPVANPNVTATANSITLSWPTVSGFPAVTQYKAVLARVDNVQSAQVITLPAGFHSATFTGVPSGVPFGAFVLAVNAYGESRVPWLTLGGLIQTNTGQVVSPALTYQTVVAASPPPGGVQHLDVTSGRSRLNVVADEPDAIDGVTRTEIVINQCGFGPCTAGSPGTQVGDVTFGGANAGITLPANTPPGTVFQLQAREINTVGASTTFTQSATYLPLAPALPPTSVTVTPQADGGTTVSFTPPAEPNVGPAILTGYVPHATPDDYAVQVVVPGQSFPEVVDFLDPGQHTDTFRAADLKLAPGTYSVQVLAENFTWGNAAPVGVAAPLGTTTTPPPVPVTAKATPAAPPQPANLVVPPVFFDGHNESFDNTMTWSEPASGAGVATPDEFVITMRDPSQPSVPPTVVEVPGTQRSYQYQVMFANQYDVNVYAVSQAAGSSAPATAVGTGPGL